MGTWSVFSERPLPISMAVSVLPVLLVVSLFARRILHPTRALAAAAERISRGERIAPLPVSGPAELREVTEAFNAMQQRLTRFIADRTTMLAAIGHDFRTPLAALRLQVELLDDEAARAPMRRLLDDMRDSLPEVNEEREQQGFSPLALDGWDDPPHYDKDNHHLVWCLRVSDKEGASSNYNTRVLGRKGHVSINLVTDPARVATDKPHALALLKATQFTAGSRYEDFDASTDKVAEYGLAGLVAGALKTQNIPLSKYLL